MSVLCWELQDSMSGSVTNEDESGESRELSRRYLIGQCLGFNDAIRQIERYAPAYVNGDGAGVYWIRRKLSAKAVGNRYFDCTASYATFQPKGGGEEEDENGQPTPPIPGTLAWDTSGNTEHITQALSEEVSPASEPSFEDAINVTGDSVQGIDIVRPSLRYSETWIFPALTAMDPTFIGSVNELTGSVNAEQFRAFAPGEALFMGGKAQWKGDEPFVAVTFDFDCRRNGEFYVKGLAPVQKKGWEYCWIRYRDDVSGDSLIRRPRAIYKNRVYPEKPWAGLLIVGRSIASRRTGRSGSPTAAQQVANFLP